MASLNIDQYVFMSSFTVLAYINQFPVYIFFLGLNTFLKKMFPIKIEFVEQKSYVTQ